MSVEHNIIVLSDLHLGQDLCGLTQFRALRRIARVDQELCAFLRYYAKNRLDGRPWRLVLAGDVFDFLQVSLRPEGAEVKTRWSSFRPEPDEVAYGVGYGPERALWKLERIVARHRRVFRTLAEFVAAGNELCVVRGNHDDELHSEAVQQALVELLEELLQRTHPGEDARLRERIRFYPWFYYQEGLLYVEHGHQYDAFSSLEYFLEPVTPSTARLEDVPLAVLALRYFANQLPGFPVHEQDVWTAKDYVRWVVRKGNPLKLLFMFWRMVAKVLFVHRRGRARPRQAGWIERRLGELARMTGVPAETLRRMVALHVKPVGHSLWRTLQMFFLDRFLVLAAVCLSLAAAVWVDAGALARAAWIAGTLGAGGWALWRLGRARDVRCNRKLADAARALAEWLRVKFVVMGHTHEAIARPAGDEARTWYVNTGTWIPPRVRRAHAGACDCHLTHVAVLHEGGDARARLLRWCGAARRPEPIEEVG